MFPVLTSSTLSIYKDDKRHSARYAEREKNATKKLLARRADWFKLWLSADARKIGCCMQLSSLSTRLHSCPRGSKEESYNISYSIFMSFNLFAMKVMSQFKKQSLWKSDKIWKEHWKKSHDELFIIDAFTNCSRSYSP